MAIPRMCVLAIIMMGLVGLGPVPDTSPVGTYHLDGNPATVMVVADDLIVTFPGSKEFTPSPHYWFQMAEAGLQLWGYDERGRVVLKETTATVFTEDYERIGFWNGPHTRIAWYVKQ